MKKEPKVDQAARLFFVLLRYEANQDQAEFSVATRIARSQISVYERGDRSVPDFVLERAADARRFPRSLLQPARRAIRSFRAATRGWSRADRMLAETFFAELLALTGEALEVIFTVAAPAPQQEVCTGARTTDRDLARELWLRLERRNAGQRLALVEEIQDFQSAALCELVAAKSIEAAPSSPSEALVLAALALRIAELCPGDLALRQRAQGYAWFHVANARRVTNDLPRSDAALTTATSLWKAGAPGDPGFFNEAIVLGLDATLQKSQRRFSEALKRVEEALAADHGDLRGKLLLSNAQILGAIGDVEASTEVLRQAILHIDPEQEPRLALGVYCEFLFNLCFQGRAAEAAPLLPRVHPLAEQLGQEVDLVRIAFLGGMIAAGTGRAEEAEKAFEEARRKFVSFNPPLVLDYALVSLDLGLLLLEQGRTSEVRTLAEQMVGIFRSQGIHREALAALQIFCEAAERETATVELTRRVIRYLHQSQYDPELKFDAGVSP